jgi:hypothetical protein
LETGFSLHRRKGLKPGAFKLWVEEEAEEEEEEEEAEEEEN